MTDQPNNLNFSHESATNQPPVIGGFDVRQENLYPKTNPFNLKAMQTHVTFGSDGFNRTNVRPNFINPCCFGEDVADWLIKRLTDPKLTVAPEPCKEDWGWEVRIASRRQAEQVRATI